MTEDLVLNRRYRLRKRLAAGGMGEVWEALDEALARPVAVKLLRQQYVADDGARARFQAEARYAAQLQHSGIAQVYDYGEQDDRAFLVMELVRGEPLSKILSRSGRLSPEATLDLVAQAARALHVAHTAGIIHRDIKPANLMVTGAGIVKITDFGIARGLSVSTMTQTGVVMGTAHYVSPEQASGQRVTTSTDLYSLGVVAYECLIGEPPFQAEAPVAIALKHVREDPPDLPEAIPAPVRALVLELLSKNADDRPESARQVADRAFLVREALGEGAAAPELEELTGPMESGDHLVTGPPPRLAGVTSYATRAIAFLPERRQPALLVGVVAAGVLVLGGIVLASMRGPSTADLVTEKSAPPSVVEERERQVRSVLPSPTGTVDRPEPMPEFPPMPTPSDTPTPSTSASPDASPSDKPTKTPPPPKTEPPEETPPPDETTDPDDPTDPGDPVDPETGAERLGSG